MLDSLNASGKLMLSHTKLNDRLTLRFSIGQTNTQLRHVEQAWRAIQAEADLLK
jgi:aromatic-L-amino-acid decarboxylase